MKVLILDNFDSFTYNLSHYVEALGAEVDVIRNDVLDLDIVTEYDRVILSPGPGLPVDAGCMPALISRYAGEIPILGICLGHQGIAEHFGATLFNMPEVIHGRSTPCIPCEEDSLFNGLPDRFEVGHYHSWAVTKADFPTSLVITSKSETGLILSFRHKTMDIRGLQFHPESILTPHGRRIIQNWLDGPISLTS
jgi:anthranilate synthase component 2